MSSVTFRESKALPKTTNRVCSFRPVGEEGRRRYSSTACSCTAGYTVRTHGFFGAIGYRTGEPYRRDRDLCARHYEKFKAKHPDIRERGLT